MQNEYQDFEYRNPAPASAIARVRLCFHEKIIKTSQFYFEKFIFEFINIMRDKKNCEIRKVCT